MFINTYLFKKRDMVYPLIFFNFSVEVDLKRTDDKNSQIEINKIVCVINLYLEKEFYIVCFIKISN
ncbi:hypothetical protein BDCR2A_01760 [Borrelia duttonii CR2A]|uniref:Uncharacterized protein n=1 Tax=Borrelia duttonii CR2A TaxID=1432657 RepID=W6TF60_9SPIR|nr:hypothetical protein BDCR2A_01760 [Borrelia duttonii CR2A]